MAKENDQTKERKEITNKAKKIKEKIMNKVEDKIEKEQIKDLEMAQKTPPIIEKEMVEKEPINHIGTDELVSALKIPMQDVNVESDPVDVHSAIFDSEDEEVEETEEVEEENLNDRYFEDDGQSEDEFDSDFFKDSKLMAEMGVEIIDLGFQTLAMTIAQDFDNPKKYEVSDYKKSKIKKPLELLLRKRGAKVSPEVMFGVVLLVVYAPTMISAINVRKEKNQARKKQKTDSADQIPSHIQDVHPIPETRETPTPIVVNPDPIKKKGRPKGSKDVKKRSTKGYKGNSNAS